MSDPPTMLGPYKILRRIGEGGMGEVFLAHHVQLDRKVAIKKIRLDESLSDERRKRFHREAKVAARLNHSALVHVYDIFQQDGQDYLVMEYVEGKTLRQVLDQETPNLNKKLAMAAQIAHGLAEAHDHHIVHRDLKPENVLITPEGRAKIADFGVAKNLLQEGDPTDLNRSLTRDGTIVGTSRAMSPEQARGEVLDHRSDLFSLGSLLYELFSGVSPFADTTHIETLNRVISHQQKPARELNPELPESLSSLIDHLLQKSLYLRPATTREVAQALDELVTLSNSGATLEGDLTIPILGSGRSQRANRRSPRSRIWLVAALLSALAAIAVYYFLLQPKPVALKYVAVLEPRLQLQDERDGAIIGSGIRDALLRTLVGYRDLYPLDPARVDRAVRQGVSPFQMLGADEIIDSALLCQESGCILTLRRIRGQDESLLWTENVEAPYEDRRILSDAVSATLSRGYQGQRTQAGVIPLDVGSQDYERYLRLLERYQRREPPIEKTLEDLQALRARCPNFPDIYRLESNVARYLFSTTRTSAYLEHGFEVAKRGAALAPNDPRPLTSQLSLALAAKQLERAEAILDQLEALYPGSNLFNRKRAVLLENQGEPARALTLMRAAVVKQSSWDAVFDLANMEYRQGNIEQARGHLQELLDRVPGNRRALRLLAQLELLSGSPERARELYQNLVAQKRQASDLTNLGTAELLLRRYGEAAGNFKEALAKTPDNAFIALNLADAEWLMGNQPEARIGYEQVLALIARDPSKQGSQFLTVKAQALAHLGRNREAVGAVLEALRLAPNNPQTAYEASLVYALIGERESALLHAEKALQSGLDPRWYTFPWFDPLRDAPDFPESL